MDKTQHIRNGTVDYKCSYCDYKLLLKSNIDNVCIVQLQDGYFNTDEKTSHQDSMTHKTYNTNRGLTDNVKAKLKQFEQLMVKPASMVEEFRAEGEIVDINQVKNFLKYLNQLVENPNLHIYAEKPIYSRADTDFAYEWNRKNNKIR